MRIDTQTNSLIINYREICHCLESKLSICFNDLGYSVEAQPLRLQGPLSRNPCVLEISMRTPLCSVTVTSMRNAGHAYFRIAHSSGVVSPSTWLHGPCQCNSGLGTTCITSMPSHSICTIRLARPTVAPSHLCRLWRMCALLPSKREIT